MATRFAEGFDLYSVLDAKMDDRVGVVQPNDRPEVFALPKLRIRGIEKDGTNWRARPWWLGRKHRLGTFKRWEAAEAVVRRFWVERLGLFFELGGYMGNYLIDADAKDVPICRRRRRSNKPNKGIRVKHSRAEPLPDGGIFREPEPAPVVVGDEFPRLYREAC